MSSAALLLRRFHAQREAAAPTRALLVSFGPRSPLTLGFKRLTLFSLPHSNIEVFNAKAVNLKRILDRSALLSGMLTLEASIATVRGGGGGLSLGSPVQPIILGAIVMLPRSLLFLFSVCRPT